MPTGPSARSSASVHRAAPGPPRAYLTPTSSMPPASSTDVARGQDAAREAHLRRLADPQGGLAGAPHLARQARPRRTPRCRRGPAGCGTRRRPRRRRPGRPRAPSTSRPPATLTNTSSPSSSRPTRFSSTARRRLVRFGSRPIDMRRGRAERGGRDERLHLDQHRPRALQGGHHRGARRAREALGQEQRRRVGHRAQAGARHLEDAQLRDGAEAVLHRAHDAVVLALLALEVQHRVHDVLEGLRARPGCRPW